MRHFLWLFLLSIAQLSIAQNVGIGTNTPHGSAALEVAGTDKGMLIPRMTMAQRMNMVNLTKGLTVYQIDNTEGYWYYDGTEWGQLMKMPSGPTEGQLLTYCSGKLTWTTDGFCPATLTSINCAAGATNGALRQGFSASGVSSVITYTGGNGGPYAAQSISSTGVTGLTATLAAGSVASGSGNLTYTITGTPSTSGVASFAISLGGQSCTLNRTVYASGTAVGITAHSCGATNVHNSILAYGSMNDQEGNLYRTIQIGNQTWMAENLRTSIYRNGTNITNITTDNTQWASNTTGAYSSFNNNTANDCPYGKLYNWYAVNNANQLCPTGWHVPTDAEWTTLTTFLGGESVAGGKMKSTGTQYWLSLNTDATNSSGWSGLPGGYRDFDGPFSNFGNFGLWWSSTEYTTGDAWGRNLDYLYGLVGRGYVNKTFGFSVRCLRD